MRRARRARGAAAVEYIIVLTLIMLAGLKITLDFERLIKCKMTDAPGHASECSGSGSVQLKPNDDGCIGLVCSSSKP